MSLGSHVSVMNLLQNHPAFVMFAILSKEVNVILCITFLCFSKYLSPLILHKTFLYLTLGIMLWVKPANTVNKHICWPPSRSVGSLAWHWGQRWLQQKEMRTLTQTHASYGTDTPSPSGNSILRRQKKNTNPTRRNEGTPYTFTLPYKCQSSQ